MADKLVLVDLSGIAHPIYHANANDSNPNATSIAIVERIRAMCSAHPHAAICCDSGRSFRRDIDPTYKANRIDGDKDAERARIQHQITLAVEILRGDGFPVWSEKGFEADDVIASAAYRFNRYADIQHPILVGCDSVLIISADKDLRQLVSERVEVFAPGIAVRPSVTYDVAAVVNKHGVQPHQLLDYLALVGDTSDNIKGAKGIGEKTAASLLNTFGNLDDLFAAIDAGKAAIKPAGLASLAEFRTRMETVRSLIRLRTDVPIPFEEIFKERVPRDVAVFGGDEMEVSDEDMGGHTGVVGVGGNDPDNGNSGGEGHTERGSVDHGSAGNDGPEKSANLGGNNALDNTRQVKVATTELAPVDWERQLEPRSMSQAIQVSNLLRASHLEFGKGYVTGESILSTIIAGREMGLPAMASLRAFHIIENKPTLSAGVIVAMVLRSGLAEYFRCSERTAERATYVTKRKSDPEPMSLTFTIEEGKQAWTKEPAAFLKSGWGKNPKDMLVARASTKLARLVYPDVVMGLYSPEEMD